MAPVLLENISKVYRIGMKDELHDSFLSATFDFFKSPLKNYRKYRSLYKFDDFASDQTDNSRNNQGMGEIININVFSCQIIEKGYGHFHKQHPHA